MGTTRRFHSAWQSGNLGQGDLETHQPMDQKGSRMVTLHRFDETPGGIQGWGAFGSLKTVLKKPNQSNRPTNQTNEAALHTTHDLPGSGASDGATFRKRRRPSTTRRFPRRGRSGRSLCSRRSEALWKGLGSGLGWGVG